MRSSRTWLRLKQRSALRGGFGASPGPCAAAAAAGCSAAPLGDALAGGDAAPDGVGSAGSPGSAKNSVKKEKCGAN